MRAQLEYSWAAMPRAGAPIVLFAAWLVLAASLHADPLHAAPLRVAIVRPQRHDQRVGEAVVRLGAEIRDAGFEPVVVDAMPGEAPRDQVERVRGEPRPFATIAVVPTRRGVAVDVWVADHLSAKTAVRRIDISTASREEAPRTVAIRAVELLKASLLELDRPAAAGTPVLPEQVARWMRSAEPPASPAIASVKVDSAAPGASSSPTSTTRSGAFAAPPTVARPSEPTAEGPPPSHGRQRPWHAFASEPSAEVTAAWLFATGGIHARSLVARTGLPLDEAWAMRLSLTETLPDAVVANAAGTVRVRQEVALAEVALAAWNRDGRFVPVGTLGFGGYHMHVESRARPPFESRTGDAWAFALSASFGLAVRLADSLAVVGELSAIAITPRVRVQILEETPAGTGSALLRPGVGLWASF